MLSRKFKIGDFVTNENELWKQPHEVVNIEYVSKKKHCQPAILLSLDGPQLEASDSDEYWINQDLVELVTI